MQKYRKYFTTDSRSVVIASIEEYDIQTLLKESKLLITDYSSVFFDFAYMNKPTIYYQFDEEDFFGSQYDKGYFDYRDNGFGDVVTQKRALLEAIKKVVNNNFEMEEKYKERIKGFFVLHDEKNRERIYNEIIKL
jgi:CDP-glycerol glycerophosphotransferase (TagB/SpsB family)